MSDETWEAEELAEMAQELLDMGSGGLKVVVKDDDTVAIKSKMGVTLGSGASVQEAVIAVIRNVKASSAVAKDAHALFLAGAVAIDPDVTVDAVTSVVEGDDEDDDVDGDGEDDEDDDIDVEPRGRVRFERE